MYQRPFCLPSISLQRANYAVLQVPVQAILTAALVPFQLSVFEVKTQSITNHLSSPGKSHPDRPSPKYNNLNTRDLRGCLGPWRPTLPPTIPFVLPSIIDCLTFERSPSSRPLRRSLIGLVAASHSCSLTNVSPGIPNYSTALLELLLPLHQETD